LAWLQDRKLVMATEMGWGWGWDLCNPGRCLNHKSHLEDIPESDPGRRHNHNMLFEKAYKASMNLLL
jgi:hypothetical protein